MTPIDIPTLLNWLVPGIIGLLLGTFSSWLANRYQRRRDDIAWAREQEKLKQNFEHEKSMLALQFQQKLEELEQQLSLQKSARLREQILKDVDDANRVIREIRTFEGLPIYRSVHAGPAGTFDFTPPSEDVEHAVILEGIIHVLYPVRKTFYEDFQALLNKCKRLGWMQVQGRTMNLAHPIPIEDDDFVLICQEQEMNDNDIVVVSLQDTLLLRRYNKSENVLYSESTEQGKTYLPLQISQEIKIIAVVLGVAKAK